MPSKTLKNFFAPIILKTSAERITYSLLFVLGVSLIAFAGTDTSTWIPTVIRGVGIGMTSASFVGLILRIVVLNPDTLAPIDVQDQLDEMKKSIELVSTGVPVGLRRVWRERRQIGNENWFRFIELADKRIDILATVYTNYISDYSKFFGVINKKKRMIAKFGF